MEADNKAPLEKKRPPCVGIFSRPKKSPHGVGKNISLRDVIHAGCGDILGYLQDMTIVPVLIGVLI